MDETTGSAGNTAFGVAGAALALVVIASGTTALINQTGKGETLTCEGVRHRLIGLQARMELNKIFLVCRR